MHVIRISKTWLCPTSVCPVCRLSHDRRNWPTTRAEALVAGRYWPQGLLHRGKPPRTLRQLLEGQTDG